MIGIDRKKRREEKRREEKRREEKRRVHVSTHSLLPMNQEIKMKTIKVDI